MGIKTRNIEHGYKVLFRSAQDMLSTAVSGAALQGMGTGAPPLTEVSTSGFAGFLMANGDTVHDVIMSPHDANPLHPAYVRVIYTVNTTNAGHGVTWIGSYVSVPTDGANSVFLDDSLSAFDTQIAADDAYGSTTEYALKKSAFGVIDSIGKSDSERTGAGGELLHVQFEQDAADTAPIFLGYELWYQPVLFGEGTASDKELAAPSEDT